MEPRAVTVTSPRPHDLLRLSDAAADSLPADAPPWTRCTLTATPWVVVRRAAAPDGLIAVGIRGSSRSHRYAWHITPADVHQTVAPEDLTAVDPPHDRGMPALRALSAVRTPLAETGATWGPTGSVGFELTTGAPTATPDSDLDLVIRAADLTPETLARLTALRQRFDLLGVRVDCQLETRTGAIALPELLSTGRDILVKTPLGPRLLPRAAAVS
jgi:phosphoribosyl-dephospho-CoA transferase